MEEYRDLLLKIIKRYLPDCKVYLFGSRARKTHLEGADMDIALDNDGPIDQKVLFSITNAIDESKIPVFVDIVDFHSISNDMKEQIVKDRLIWKN